MSRKISVKCAMAGCYGRLKMTPEERQELRRIGRENNATAGVICPKDVKAAFNFEYEEIDVDVPWRNTSWNPQRKLHAGA